MKVVTNKIIFFSKFLIFLYIINIKKKNIFFIFKKFKINFTLKNIYNIFFYKYLRYITLNLSYNKNYKKNNKIIKKIYSYNVVSNNQLVFKLKFFFYYFNIPTVLWNIRWNFFDKKNLFYKKQTNNYINSNVLISKLDKLFLNQMQILINNERGFLIILKKMRRPSYLKLRFYFNKLLKIYPHLFNNFSKLYLYNKPIFFINKQSLKNILTSLNFLSGERCWWKHNFFFFFTLSEKVNLNYLSFLFKEYFLLKNLLSRRVIKLWKNFFLNFHKNIFKKIHALKYFELFFLNNWNYFYTAGLAKSKKNKIWRIYLKYISKTTKFLFLNFISKTIFSITQQFIFLKFIKNRQNILHKKIEKILIFKLENYNLIFKKNYFLKEFSMIIFYTAIYKEPKFLLNWIRKNFTSLFYRQHLIFIQFLNNAIKIIFNFFKSKLNLFGLRIIFRGKIGQVGSVRKKKYVVGNLSVFPSNVFIKSDKLVSVIKTYTGVIGFEVFLSYF